MKKTPFWLSLLFVALTAAALGGIIYQRHQAQNELMQLIGAQLLQPEKIAAPLALPPLTDMQGRPVQLASDRPILLHFWATWCPSCLQEITTITNLSASFQNSLQVITVSVDSDQQALENFLRENRYTLPVLRSQPLQSSLPVTYLLTKNGAVRYRFTGAKPWGAPHAAQQLEQLLKELP